jgi:MFS family permease
MLVCGSEFGCFHVSLFVAGSQIPLYFVGGSLGFIAADIGGTKVSAWLPVAYALALASVAPFCGYLQDLMGRRNITLFGGLVLMVGIIVVGTAKTFGSGVVGMALAGAGAAVVSLFEISCEMQTLTFDRES